MKPQQAISLIPLAMFAPQLVIGAAIGLGLLWLLSKDEPFKLPFDEEQPNPADDAEEVPQASPRRITREDLAEALKYGAQPVTRKQAVEALQVIGFQKSSAYAAISPNGKFADLLGFTPDGMVEWKG